MPRSGTEHAYFGQGPVEYIQRFFWEITSFFLAPDFCGSQQRPRKAANIQSVNLPCRPSGTIIKLAETSNLKAIIVIKVSKFQKQIFWSHLPLEKDTLAKICFI